MQDKVDNSIEGPKSKQHLLLQHSNNTKIDLETPWDILSFEHQRLGHGLAAKVAVGSGLLDKIHKAHRGEKQPKPMTNGWGILG